VEAVPSESVQLDSAPQRASQTHDSVRLSSHLIWFIDVKTQLPLRGNKLRLVFIDLYIFEFVVYETDESRYSLGTDDYDAADKRTVHETLDETEDVLHTTSCLGLWVVVQLLIVGKKMISIVFLTDNRNHTTFLDYIVLWPITCIRV